MCFPGSDSGLGTGRCEGAQQDLQAAHKVLLISPSASYAGGSWCAFLVSIPTGEPVLSPQRPRQLLGWFFQSGKVMAPNCVNKIWLIRGNRLPLQASVKSQRLWEESVQDGSLKAPRFLLIPSLYGSEQFIGSEMREFPCTCVPANLPFDWCGNLGQPSHSHLLTKGRICLVGPFLVVPMPFFDPLEDMAMPPFDSSPLQLFMAILSTTRSSPESQIPSEQRAEFSSFQSICGSFCACLARSGEHLCKQQVWVCGGEWPRESGTLRSTELCSPAWSDALNPCSVGVCS